MQKLNEFLYINELLMLYGRLLTSHQQEIMRDYYGFNLSFSEIAENRLITRAAVSDAITKATEKLLNYEEALKLYETKDTLLKDLENLKEKITDKEIVEEIISLERKIKDGI